MPEDPHFIKQNDTASAIKRVLTDAFGSPVNLTGATLTFSMRVKPAGTTKISTATATVSGAGLGEVQYSFTAANTDTADEFEGEFTATYAGGGIQTFPNDGYIPIIITDDVA
jgi:hypothetical protein